MPAGRSRRRAGDQRIVDPRPRSIVRRAAVDIETKVSNFADRLPGQQRLAANLCRREALHQHPQRPADGHFIPVNLVVQP